MSLIKKLYPLGFKNDFYELLKIALPIILSNFSGICITITSVVFCGHLGPDELAGVSLGTLMINIFGQAPIYGFASACDTLFPQIFGGDDKKKIGIILQKSIVISIITSFISCSIFLNTKYIFNIAMHDPHVVELADGYMRSFLPGIFMISLSAQLTKYVQSQDIVLPIMFLNLVAVAINVVLQYLFVFVFNFGINGAAYAIVISTASLVIMILIFIRVKNIHLVTWPGWSLECFIDWQMYLKLAIPGFIMLALEWSAWEIATLVSATNGTLAIDSLSICQQFLFIFYQIPLGFGIAGNIYPGHFLGANKPEEAINATKVFSTIIFIIAITNSLTMFALSSYLPMLFVNDAELLESASQLLRVTAGCHFLDCITCAVSSTLRTLGKQFIGSILIIISFYVIGMPIGVYLMTRTYLQNYGWFIAVGICLPVLIISQLIVVYRSDWAEYAQKAYDLAKFEAPEIQTKVTDMENQKVKKPSMSIIFMKRFPIYIIVIVVFLISIFLNGPQEKQLAIMAFNLTNSSFI